MKRSLAAAALAALMFVGLGQKSEAGFKGGLGAAVFNPAINTTDLVNASTFTFGSIFASSSGSGDFAYVPSGSALSNAPSAFTLGSSTALTFTSAFGTFTETAAPLQTSFSVVNNFENSRTFYILGTFTPSSLNPTYSGQALQSSLTVNFTQSSTGNPVSSSFSLDVPPLTLAVPEPASVAMLGMGLVGVVGFAARRRARSAA